MRICCLLQTAIAESPPATVQHTGIIKPGYSEELDDLMENSAFAREWIAGLEKVERERLGIKSLKVGYNKVHGYYIEVTKSNTDMVPDDYIRKQTLVNAERYITPEMKDYEAQVLNAEEQIHEVELRLFKEINTQLAKSANQLLETARAIAELDVLGHPGRSCCPARLHPPGSGGRRHAGSAGQPPSGGGTYPPAG